MKKLLSFLSFSLFFMQGLFANPIDLSQGAVGFEAAGIKFAPYQGADVSYEGSQLKVGINRTDAWQGPHFHFPTIGEAENRILVLKIKGTTTVPFTIYVSDNNEPKIFALESVEAGDFDIHKTFAVKGAGKVFMHQRALGDLGDIVFSSFTFENERSDVVARTKLNLAKLVEEKRDEGIEIQGHQGAGITYANSALKVDVNRTGAWQGVHFIVPGKPYFSLKVAGRSSFDRLNMYAAYQKDGTTKIIGKPIEVIDGRFDVLHKFDLEGIDADMPIKVSIFQGAHDRTGTFDFDDVTFDFVNLRAYNAAKAVYMALDSRMHLITRNLMDIVAQYPATVSKEGFAGAKAALDAITGPFDAARATLDAEAENVKVQLSGAAKADFEARVADVLAPFESLHKKATKAARSYHKKKIEVESAQTRNYFPVKFDEDEDLEALGQGEIILKGRDLYEAAIPQHLQGFKGRLELRFEMLSRGHERQALYSIYVNGINQSKAVNIDRVTEPRFNAKQAGWADFGGDNLQKLMRDRKGHTVGGYHYSTTMRKALRKAFGGLYAEASVRDRGSLEQEANRISTRMLKVVSVDEGVAQYRFYEMFAPKGDETYEVTREEVETSEGGDDLDTTVVDPDDAGLAATVALKNIEGFEGALIMGERKQKPQASVVKSKNDQKLLAFFNKTLVQEPNDKKRYDVAYVSLYPGVRITKIKDADGTVREIGGLITYEVGDRIVKAVRIVGAQIKFRDQISFLSWKKFGAHERPYFRVENKQGEEKDLLFTNMQLSFHYNPEREKGYLRSPVTDVIVEIEGKRYKVSDLHIEGKRGSRYIDLAKSGAPLLVEAAALPAAFQRGLDVGLSRLGTGSGRALPRVPARPANDGVGELHGGAGTYVPAVVSAPTGPEGLFVGSDVPPAPVYDPTRYVKPFEKAAEVAVAVAQRSKEREGPLFGAADESDGALKAGLAAAILSQRQFAAHQDDADDFSDDDDWWVTGDEVVLERGGMGSMMNSRFRSKDEIKIGGRDIEIKYDKVIVQQEVQVEGLKKSDNVRYFDSLESSRTIGADAYVTLGAVYMNGKYHYDKDAIDPAVAIGLRATPFRTGFILKGGYVEFDDNQHFIQKAEIGGKIYGYIPFEYEGTTFKMLTTRNPMKFINQDGYIVRPEIQGLYITIMGEDYLLEDVVLSSRIPPRVGGRTGGYYGPYIDLFETKKKKAKRLQAAQASDEPPVAQDRPDTQGLLGAMQRQMGDRYREEGGDGNEGRDDVVDEGGSGLWGIGSDTFRGLQSALAGMLGGGGGGE